MICLVQILSEILKSNAVRTQFKVYMTKNVIAEYITMSCENDDKLNNYAGVIFECIKNEARMDSRRKIFEILNRALLQYDLQTLYGPSQEKFNEIKEFVETNML